MFFFETMSEEEFSVGEELSIEERKRGRVDSEEDGVGDGEKEASQKHPCVIDLTSINDPGDDHPLNGGITPAYGMSEEEEDEGERKEGVVYSWWNDDEEQVPLTPATPKKRPLVIDLVGDDEEAFDPSRALAPLDELDVSECLVWKNSLPFDYTRIVEDLIKIWFLRLLSVRDVLRWRGSTRFWLGRINNCDPFWHRVIAEQQMTVVPSSIVHPHNSVMAFVSAREKTRLDGALKICGKKIARSQNSARYRRQKIADMEAENARLNREEEPADAENEKKELEERMKELEKELKDCVYKKKRIDQEGSSKKRAREWKLFDVTEERDKFVEKAKRKKAKRKKLRGDLEFLESYNAANGYGAEEPEEPEEKEEEDDE